MPRIARKDLQTSFFHVIVQGINKEYIFKKRNYIKKYIELLNKYKEEYNVTILAYCIMNNHAHMLIYTEDIEKMTKYMHRIDGIYAQYYNQMEERVGVVFRNRYESEPIYNEKYLIHCIRYIHMNPVNAGMVKECKEYEYSTYNDYQYNIGVAKSEILMKIFGNNFIKIFNENNEYRVFKDIEINVEEIIDEAIIRFENEKNQKIDNIIKDKVKLKELVKFLRTNYKIKYVDMMKSLNITPGEMNSLKK